MQAASYSQPYTRILYDADCLERPTSAWFTPDHWVQHGAIETFRQGRGGCWKVELPIGSAVIKHYRRGGMMAKISFDRYLFTGWERSRSLREWRLLADLYQQGLPVPAPLAAICVRYGRSYRACLMTRYINGAIGLNRLIANGVPELPEVAEQTGRMLAQFHSADVNHADINLSNIVRDSSDRLWLLDFDRGRIVRMHDKRRQRAMQRLQRSLRRLSERENIAHDITRLFWEQVNSAYRAGS